MAETACRHPTGVRIRHGGARAAQRGDLGGFGLELGAAPMRSAVISVAMKLADSLGALVGPIRGVSAWTDDHQELVAALCEWAPP